MMAAISAARGGAQVVLVEPNEKVGRKLYITGKGRCNVTNHCSLEEMMASIPRNGKFLYSALSRFDAQATMDFFEDLGVKLKVERGNRVFPVSDKAADIIDALFFELRRLGVELRRDRVTGLKLQDGQVVGVTTQHSPQGLEAGCVRCGRKTKREKWYTRRWGRCSSPISACPGLWCSLPLPI